VYGEGEKALTPHPHLNHHSGAARNGHNRLLSTVSHHLTQVWNITREHVLGVGVVVDILLFSAIHAQTAHTARQGSPGRVYRGQRGRDTTAACVSEPPPPLRSDKTGQEGCVRRAGTQGRVRCVDIIDISLSPTDREREGDGSVLALCHRRTHALTHPLA